MHLNEDCTGLSEAAVNGVPALGKNALLICNKCVEEKRQDNLTQAAHETTTSKELQETQMKTLENEMTDLKKTVTEIKTLLTTKQPDSDYPTQPSSIASRQKPPPKPADELDGTRIRGIPESMEKEARLRQEHDLAKVQKVLTHMDVNASIGDVIRLGRHDENKTRTTIFKVPNAYQRRMIFLSLRKLKNSPQPIFLSRKLTKEEADQENLALVRRRQLISDKSVDRKDIRVHDATLYIRKDGKWTKEKLPDPEAPI